MRTSSIIEPPVRNGGIAAEQLGAPVEHADAGRPEHLVPGERGEVDAERGEVDRHVRHRLAGVEHGQRADRAGAAHQLRHRLDGAQHVGLVRERDDLGALGDRVDRVEVQPAVVGDRDQRSVAPVRRQSSCHGTRLAWCSISVTTISSPGPSANRSDSGADGADGRALLIA